jgi:hypothetical protein
MEGIPNLAKLEPTYYVMVFWVHHANIVPKSIEVCELCNDLRIKIGWRLKRE